ncbi:hypothetical protein WP50_04235, partial [Lactiplantibacillus plantarum]
IHGHATFVGVIESGLIGGTCPNRGCNAKITLDEPVKLTREAARLNDILSSAPTINWTANVAHKQEIIDPLPAGLTARLEDGGATIIHGHATFVGVIESGLIGGTCPNRGCNAKITLDEPVKLTREAARLNDILSSAPTINWTANVAHKQEIIDPLPAGLTARLEDGGATIIHGHATFKDAHTVVVDDQRLINHDKQIRLRCVIHWCGSRHV